MWSKRRQEALGGVRGVLGAETPYSCGNGNSKGWKDRNMGPPITKSSREER